MITSRRTITNDRVLTNDRMLANDYEPSAARAPANGRRVRTKGRGRRQRDKRLGYTDKRLGYAVGYCCRILPFAYEGSCARRVVAVDSLRDERHGAREAVELLARVVTVDSGPGPARRGRAAPSLMSESLIRVSYPSLLFSNPSLLSEFLIRVSYSSLLSKSPRQAEPRRVEFVARRMRARAQTQHTRTHAHFRTPTHAFTPAHAR